MSSLCNFLIRILLKRDCLGRAVYSLNWLPRRYVFVWGLKLSFLSFFISFSITPSKGRLLLAELAGSSACKIPRNKGALGHNTEFGQNNCLLRAVKVPLDGFTRSDI